MIKVNEYFGGDVKSLGYETTDGKATVGVMEEGNYQFSTTSMEIMKVIEGKLEVQLPGETDYKAYIKGEFFEVPAGVSFKVRSVGQSSYHCQFR